MPISLSTIVGRRTQSERILHARVLVTYLYLPLAVQLCAVSIDYECEEGKAYTYVEVMTARARNQERRSKR